MTYDEAMARLLACPALPRGDRLDWAHQHADPRGSMNRCWHHTDDRYVITPDGVPVLASFPGPILKGLWQLAGYSFNSDNQRVTYRARWHQRAYPLRLARDRAQVLRKELASARGQNTVLVATLAQLREETTNCRSAPDGA